MGQKAPFVVTLNPQPSTLNPLTPLLRRGRGMSFTLLTPLLRRGRGMSYSSTMIMICAVSTRRNIVSGYTVE